MLSWGGSRPHSGVYIVPHFTETCLLNMHAVVCISHPTQFIRNTRQTSQADGRQQQQQPAFKVHAKYILSHLWCMNMIHTYIIDNGVELLRAFKKSFTFVHNMHTSCMYTVHMGLGTECTPTPCAIDLICVKSWSMCISSEWSAYIECCGVVYTLLSHF